MTKLESLDFRGYVQGVTHVLTLRVSSKDVEKISHRIWNESGVQGIQESPLQGDMFPVDEDFQIIEFGSVAAQRCAEWLESEAFRTGQFLHLNVYLEVGDDFSLENFLERVVGDSAVLCERFEGLSAENYLENYKKSVQGSAFGEGFWIGPPWASRPADCTHGFVVEPGLAFGTGGHPTTQLCLERLSMLSKEAPWSTLTDAMDLGTGSGILAVALRRFFPRLARLIVTDLDPLCEAEVVKTFGYNVLAQALPTRGYFGEAARMQNVLRSEGAFDLIVANIYAEVLADLSKDVARLLKPRGRWVVSGILQGPSQEKLLQALPGKFRIVWSQERSLQTSMLDSAGGLRANEEVWVAYDLERV